MECAPETDRPSSLLQLVIAITGKGKVGAGARLVLEQLGVQWIQANELESISRKSSESLSSLGACSAPIPSELPS